MAQHAILRFEKHKGNPARPLEAHHERQKEQYASNPDIDTSRSKYNFHIVKPESRYYHFIQNRIEQAGCRTRKDSTRFVDTLVTASPEFFKKKSPKEIQAFFQRAADFLIDRVGQDNIVSAVVHMDEKTPHLHLTFVPLTEDNRLCAKEIIPMTMEDWASKLDAFLQFNDAEILQDKGKVTAAIAKAFAESEFEKYRVIQDKNYQSDFDRLMAETAETKYPN